MAFPVPSGRQSPRTYYFSRELDRCELYWIEDGEIGPRTDHPCVDHLQVGERIRLVGSTCIREAPERPEREKPVLCPNPLIDAEEEFIEQDFPVPSATASAVP